MDKSGVKHERGFAQDVIRMKRSAARTTRLNLTIIGGLFVGASIFWT